MSKSKKYRVIRQKLWSQPDFQDYEIEKKLMWIYLQTGTYANQLGIYPFMPRYVSLETGLSIEQIESIMSEFEKDGLIIYNRETREVAVFNFFEDQVAKGGTAVTQCLESDLKKVQDTSLIDAVLQHNLPLMDDLPKTAKDFLDSIIQSKGIGTINDNKEDNTDNEEVNSENRELISKKVEVRINTGDNTESVRTPVRDYTTDTGNDVITIPTVEMVSQYITDVYFTDTDTSNKTANKFVTLNEQNQWQYLKHSTWQNILDKFLSNDKNHVFNADAVSIRKAEAEKKAEELRAEEERKAEQERKQQEYKSMFRECWNPYSAINTAQGLIDYIKANHFSEYDYSLGSCLYDQLYVSHTLEEIMVMSLFDKHIILYDEVGDYISISDYGIGNANAPIQAIAEKLKKDSWSEKYRVPEPPKVIVPYQSNVPRQG